MSLTALVLWALLALVLLVLLSAATRPKTFRVERSLVVQAAAENVLELLQDFHRWVEWSPWESLDPTMQRSYSGAASGPGAVYDWRSTGKAGAGRMEILQVAPGRLHLRLDFSKPFVAHNSVEFSLTAQGAATQVTWAMFGPSPFVSRLMGLVFNLDRMIGRDFEKGLANLRAVLEDGAAAAARG